jgi:hypothetical protein
MKFYFNGKLEATTAETGTPDTSADLLDYLIGEEDGQFYLNGAVSGPFIMDRTLNEGEVRFLYENPYGFVEDPGPFEDPVVEFLALGLGRVVTPVSIAHPGLIA